MNIIDALILSVGFDTTKLETGQKEANAAVAKTKDDSVKHAKEAEAAGKRVGEAIGKHLTESFLKLAAVLTGGVAFKDFITDIGKADLAVNRLATSIGVKTESISAFENAFERAGLRASDADSAFSSLNDTIQKIAIHGTGSGPLANLANAAARAGVKGSSFAGVTDPEEMAYRVARDLAGVKAKFGAGLATSLGGDLGLNFGATTFFEQGEGPVRAAIAKSKELGVAGAASAAAWAKFTDTLVSLRQAVAELGRTLMTGLTPAITGILDRMREWIERNQAWLDQKINAAIEWLGRLINSIDWNTVVDGAKTFAGQVQRVVEFLGGWKAVAEELFALWIGEKFMHVLANVALLVAALAGSGGGIVGGALALLGTLGAFLLGSEFMGALKGAEESGHGLSPEGMEYGPQIPGHEFRQGAEGSRGGWQGGGSGAPAAVDPNNPVLRAIHKSAGGDSDIEKTMQNIYSGESGHAQHWDVGDSGDSYGPFQFDIAGGRLGAQFQRETGKDPRDPKSLQAMADYTAKKLREMRAKGQNPVSVWHGLANPKGHLTGGYAPGLKLEGEDAATKPQSSLANSRHYAALGGAHVAARTYDNQVVANNYDVDTTVGSVAINTSSGPSSDSGNLSRDNLRRVKRAAPANFGLA